MRVSILMDRVAMTEQVTLLEDTDSAMGGLPDSILARRVHPPNGQKVRFEC